MRGSFAKKSTSRFRFLDVPKRLAGLQNARMDCFHASQVFKFMQQPLEASSVKTAFNISRAVFINTLFDVLVISLVLHIADELLWENVFFAWLALLIARFVLGLRKVLLSYLEHWLFRSEKIDRLTAALRVSGVPRNYEIVPEFEALAHSVLNDDNAGLKAKQLVSELTGYAQCAAETSTIRGINFRLILDAAARRYLASA